MENTIAKAAERNARTAPPAQKAEQSINVMLNNLLDKEKYRARFEDLLGKRAPQFVSSIVSMVNADAKLQQAFYQSPLSVIQSALKAATFDLPIDPGLGYAYIVPFNNTVDTERGKEKRMEASFILGWKGMHQMALRSGVYKTINVVDVRQGEFVSFNRLTGDLELVFIEDEEEREKLPIVGYAGYYRLINGAEKNVYMTRKQVEAHERKFRKGQYMGKGWKTDFDAMALKTVYRQLIGKWGIMSIDYRSSDEAAALVQQMEDEDKLLLPDSSVIDGSFQVLDGEQAEDGQESLMT